MKCRGHAQITKHTKMISLLPRFSALTLVILLISNGLLAQTDKKEDPKIRPIYPLKSFKTEHTWQSNGQALQYEVLAGDIYLSNKMGEPIGAMWSTSYLKKTKPNDPVRPVTFIFNGGPGSASVWLHMGLFGPKLVQVASEADEDDGAAPFRMIDNPYGLLDLTDLVFIDPIGTGYSQIVGKGKTEDFWGLREDARSIATFIRLWITKHQRWNAPKFLAGESFGTTRAAVVTHELSQGGQDVALNGLVLISQAMDYTGSTPVHDNLIAFFTYLPTLAATAWYHKKAGQGKTLEAFLEEARTFAYDEYAPALLKGNLLSKPDFDRIASRLSYFTGLDEGFIKRADLRILTGRFKKELLREEGYTVGGLDSRYKSMEIDQTSDDPTLGDAASLSISSAYTAALQTYFAQDLQIEMDRPYLTSNRGLYPKWNWKPVPKDQGWEPHYVNVARHLGEALRKNKDLQVFVANGYYDLVTPFFDAEYTISRHGILKDRVDMKYYEAGHMMYTHQKDLEQLAKDMRAFLEQCLD